MNKTSLFQSIQDAFSDMAPTSNPRSFQAYQMDEAENGRGGMWEHMTGHNQELFDVSEDVATEQQARLAMLSRSSGLCQLVLSYLRQEPVHAGRQAIIREGVWIMVGLPVMDPDDDQAPQEQQSEFAASLDAVDQASDMLDRIGNGGADLLLYLVDARLGWQDSDSQWYARLRALGKPLLPVLITVVGPTDAEPAHADPLQAEQLRKKLAIQPVLLTVHEPPVLADVLPDEPPADVIELTKQMVAMCPKVSIPLAQDIVWCRHTIATRVIRTGALVTALVGAEPIPLLDLPVHVALHWKVALQLAAIHGRPGLDIRSREMVGTIGLNLCMRYLAQQILKLIPVIGWILSGALSGLSTLLLGHALLRYYENDQIWSWTETKDAWRKQRARMVRPVNATATQMANRARRSRKAAAQAWSRPTADEIEEIPITADAEDRGSSESHVVV